MVLKNSKYQMRRTVALEIVHTTRQCVSSILTSCSNSSLLYNRTTIKNKRVNAYTFINIKISSINIKISSFMRRASFHLPLFLVLLFF